MKYYTTVLLTVVSTILSCQNVDSKPKDFDSFWKETVNELNTEIVFEKIKDSIVGNKSWKLVKIKSYNDVFIYAWASEPIAKGKYPIKIRFSGFGKGSDDRNKISTPWFLKQENTINMTVDIRGQGASVDQVKYEGFLTNGLYKKETYIYRGAYMDAVKSIDFISKNPKSDGNIIVTGGSQGGALAIVATALNLKVTMCVIGFPFLTDMSSYNKKQWPMSIFMHYCRVKKVDYFELKEVLSYYDMLNFADKITVPIFIRTQEIDKTTPKEGCVKFFNQIKSDKKEIYIEPCEGHGCSSKSKRANEMEREFIKRYTLKN